MPAFLVHGVPDTHRLWDGVRAHLARRDVVAVALPGFGTDVPAGFGATKEEYVDFIVRELEHAGEPVDLVGHDWGAMLVQRVASLRPDLVRSLAFGSGVVDRAYVWHEIAEAWQTPEVGEQVMEAMTPDAFAAFLADEVGADAAAQAARHLDDRMKRCILSLYRSAVRAGEEWEDGVAALRGRLDALVLWGDSDAYCGAEFAARAAERLGAELVVFPRTGHWWPVTRAQETAAALEVLWARAR